jgi:hypothetical protein
VKVFLLLFIRHFNFIKVIVRSGGSYELSIPY